MTYDPLADVPPPGVRVPRTDTRRLGLIALLLACLPFGFTAILAFRYAKIAYADGYYNDDRGRRLAVAAMIIAGFMALAFIFSTAVGVYHRFSPGADAKTAAGVYQDVLDTVQRDEQAIYEHPGVDIRNIPVVHHGTDVITLKLVGAHDWLVTGYNPGLGSVDTGRVEWFSAGTDGYEIHGTYRQYFDYISSHTHNSVYDTYPHSKCSCGPTS